MSNPEHAPSSALDEFPDATAIAEAVRRGDVSPSEVLEAAIARAEAVQPELNFLSERLVDRARARVAALEPTGPFAGVPYLIKDMYDIAGTVTGFGSRLATIAPPAASNYSMVDDLEALGLVIFGKTTLGEFGYLPTTESLACGATRNPWNLAHTSGGSSGGSAAAVAAGVVPMADAADGGGSIRIPAACCGLFGFKPSRSRCRGDYPTGSGMQLVVEHCISHTVRDSAILLSHTERAGADRVYPPAGLVSGPSTRRLRIGVVAEGVRGHQPDAEISAALARMAGVLGDLGHEVRPTSWPLDSQRYMEDFGIVWVGGAAQVNRDIEAAIGRDTTRQLLEPYTVTLGDLGAAVTPEMLAAAIARLRADDAVYNRWFADLDVVLSPVTMTPAVEVGRIDGTVEFGELSERVARFVDVTMVHNATGASAMSVPGGWSARGLPIGMHLAGRPGDDAMLLALAYELEQAVPWLDRRPPVWAPARLA